MQQRMPPVDELVADDVGGQRTNRQQHAQGKQHAQAGHLHAQPALRLPGGRQHLQGLVQRGHHPFQHPQGDDERCEDQKSCQQPLAHGVHHGRSASVTGTGATAGGGGRRR